MFRFDRTKDRIAISLGPYIGFLLSESPEPETPREYFTKNTDYGFNFGINYIFNKFTLGINYGLGLDNLYEQIDSDPNGPFESITSRNKNIGLFMQYGF